MTDADYTDDVALLANTPTPAIPLLHSREPATARGIGLYVKVNKSKDICFKQEAAISTPTDKPRKLEDKFIYLDSNITSTDRDVNIRLAKTWCAFDRLSILSKSDESNKNKTEFLPSWGCVYTTVWMHHMDADKTH